MATRSPSTEVEGDAPTHDAPTAAPCALHVARSADGAAGGRLGDDIPPLTHAVSLAVTADVLSTTSRPATTADGDAAVPAASAIDAARLEGGRGGITDALAAAAALDDEVSTEERGRRRCIFAFNTSHTQATVQNVTRLDDTDAMRLNTVGEAPNRGSRERK